MASRKQQNKLLRVAVGYMRRQRQNDCLLYYTQGYCVKGDVCLFRHEPRAFGSTAICERWRKGVCRAVRCSHRHSYFDRDDYVQRQPSPSATEPTATYAEWQEKRGGEGRLSATFLPSRFTNENTRSCAAAFDKRVVKLMDSDCEDGESDLQVIVNVDQASSKCGRDRGSGRGSDSRRSREEDRSRLRWRSERGSDEREDDVTSKIDLKRL